jgi:hypothetical protein
MSTEQQPPSIVVPPPDVVTGGPGIPTQSVSAWYLDKGLWVMLLGVLLPFISKWLGVTLDPTKVAAYVIPIVAYILAHKAKSGAVLVAEIKARAATALGPTPTTPADAAALINTVRTPP